jgi:hypothetical protein
MAEVYTSPFCIMPGRYKDRQDDGGWIMFTPVVPWTHEVHAEAVKKMKRGGYKMISIEKSVEYCQDVCKLRDATLFTFTKHGGYPRIEEDNIGWILDTEAVKITCAALGWEIPGDWQEMRYELGQRRNVRPAMSIVDFIKGCNKENDVENQQYLSGEQMNGQDGEICHM